MTHYRGLHGFGLLELSNLLIDLPLTNCNGILFLFTKQAQQV